MNDGGKQMKVEILAGLPSDGPLPKHYHCGHPTPWRQEFVARLSLDDETSWIGNFHLGHSYYANAFVWEEAQLFVIIADGNCYFVSAHNPDGYRSYEALATGWLFNDDRTKLFVADYSDLFAFDQNGTVLWRKTLAADGIILSECTNGVISGTACYDPPELWEDFKVNEANGELLT